MQTMDSMVGMVERGSTEIVGRELRATVIMLDSPRADAVYSQLRAGAGNVSIGYRIIDSEESSAGGSTTMTTRGAILDEISFVPVPANRHTGVLSVARARASATTPSSHEGNDMTCLLYTSPSPRD